MRKIIRKVGPQILEKKDALQGFETIHDFGVIGEQVDPWKLRTRFSLRLRHSDKFVWAELQSVTKRHRNSYGGLTFTFSTFTELRQFFSELPDDIMSVIEDRAFDPEIDQFSFFERLCLRISGGVENARVVVNKETLKNLFIKISVERNKKWDNVNVKSESTAPYSWKSTNEVMTPEIFSAIRDRILSFDPSTPGNEPTGCIR